MQHPCTCDPPREDWYKNGTVGGAYIYFKSSTNNNGLIFCHGVIETQGNSKFTGSVISYYNDLELDYDYIEGASADFVYGGMKVPGFEGWFEEPEGKRKVTIMSWQRF
jgi:hypothetical protein